MPVRETEFNFNDRYQVDVVFRYAMLASFPYCTKEQALDMRNKKIPDINNNPKLLLTADNSVVNWESRSGEHWLISVSHTHKTLTVAFRGTFGLYDTMFYNADSRQVNIDSNLYSGFNGRAKIYKGVMRSLLIHVPRAREALRLLKAKYSNYHIIVTGHSLGASIARMFSLHLSLTEQELKPLMTYAFAEPMTTTKEFSDWSLSVIGRDHYLRIISSTDIVPHLRPGKNKFGHAKDAIVMYFPDPDKPEFIYCPHDGHPACRGVGARKRSWFNHNRFGGMILASNMCALVMEKQTLKNLLTIAKKMIT
ncbi:Alpha/Beta hydrolase protein [Syncephalis plumigaleata]|nr:Alpha/Beta hydrolase protein [Syncephalis plumigaleata]